MRGAPNPSTSTKCFACRDTAHKTANSGMGSADGFWSKTKCWAARELDLLGCDAQLLRDLNPVS